MNCNQPPNNWVFVPNEISKTDEIKIIALFRELSYDLNSADSFVYTNYLKRKVPNIFEGKGLKVSAGKRRKTCGTILPFLSKPRKNMSYCLLYTSDAADE